MVSDDVNLHPYNAAEEAGEGDAGEGAGASRDKLPKIPEGYSAVGRCRLNTSG